VGVRSFGNLWRLSSHRSHARHGNLYAAVYFVPNQGVRQRFEFELPAVSDQAEPLLIFRQNLVPNVPNAPPRTGTSSTRGSAEATSTLAGVSDEPDKNKYVATPKDTTPTPPEIHARVRVVDASSVSALDNWACTCPSHRACYRTACRRTRKRLHPPNRFLQTRRVVLPAPPLSCCGLVTSGCGSTSTEPLPNWMVIPRFFEAA